MNFFKKSKEKYLQISLSKSRYDPQFLRYRVKQTEIRNLRAFFALYLPKKPKIKILKNENICWRYHHFRHVHQKPQSYDVQFLRYWVRQRFLLFWIIFCPFTSPPPLMIPNIKILKKNRKKDLKILSFYKHKWQSYDVWFLRYGLQWTEFFIILDHFLPFYPPNNRKNQIRKNEKNI